MIDKQTLHQYLKEMPIINLAFIADNEPAATVLLTCVDENFNTHFASRTNSFKAQYLHDGVRVSWTSWQIGKFYLQAEGVVSTIKNETEENSYLDKITTCAQGLKDFWPPILHVSTDAETTIFRLQPTRMRVLDLASSTLTRHHGEAWQDVI